MPFASENIRFSKLIVSYIGSLKKTISEYESAGPLYIILSSTEAGRMIMEYLNERHKFMKVRSAARVLPLPISIDKYLKGRARQALRTNLAKAHSLGLNCRQVSLDNFTFHVKLAIERNLSIKYLDLLCSEKVDTCVEHWIGCDASDEPIAFARILVDTHCAYIKYICAVNCSELSIVRWLLNYSIIENLISRNKNQIISGSIFSNDSGSLYMQDRLGFETFALEWNEDARSTYIHEIVGAH